MQRRGISFCSDKQQRKGIALLLAAVIKASSMKHAALYSNSRKLRHALDLLKRKSECQIQIPTGDMSIPLISNEHPPLKEPHNLSNKVRIVSDVEESLRLLQHQSQNNQYQRPLRSKHFQVHSGHQKSTHNGPSSLQFHKDMFVVEDFISNDSKKSSIIKEKSASTIRIVNNVPNTDAVDSSNASRDNRVKEAKNVTGSGNSVIPMKDKEPVIRRLLPRRDDPLYLGGNVWSRVVEENRKEGAGAAGRSYPSKGA
jgi:hypothetical protein